jgi:adenylate kinase family enzyme
MTADNFVNISGGNVQGFIQENHGTVTQYFISQVSELISGQASGTQQPLTQVEYAQRKVLLSKVKEYWIEGVLEKSLHTQAMIELGLEKRSDAVDRPFSGFEELPEESRQILPTGTGATEVFNQIGEGRTLLILGEPGAGKTITLLKLAQNLIARAEENVSRLIPVVFNLSSWGSKHQTIADWLVQELWSKYGVPKELGKNWVKNQQLLLLLDGLDEVKADRREACVEAINQFMQKHGQTEMVVCSRIADYEVLSNRLHLRGAIYIRSLTPEQVNQYLDAAGEQLGAVKTLLNEDPALQELAKSPLTLSIMTLAYQGKKVEELPQTGLVEERREHLFNAYIERMFQRKGVKQYPKDQAIYWLTWLAQRMSQASQSVFLIEKIQPNWLQSNLQRRLYRIGTILIGILVIGLILFLGHALDSYFYKSNSDILGNLPKVMLINLVMWGLFLCWNFGQGKAEIETFETLTWPWKKTRKDLLDGLTYGIRWSIILSPIGVVWCGLSWPAPIPDILSNTNPQDNQNIIIFGLILGLIFALIIGLIRGLRGSEIETKTIPNQGIWRSARNSVIIVVVSWLILFLIIFALFPEELKLRTSIISWGLILGLLFGGGIACIQHFSLRLILWGKGFIPSNFARFLDYASERIFLQKVGGSYIFVHRMLVEHFATRIHPTQSEIRNAYKTIKIIFVGGVIVVSSIVVYKVCLNNAEYQLSIQANMLISTMDSVRKYNNDHITPLLKTQSEQNLLLESIPDFTVNQVFNIFTSVYKNNENNYGYYLYRSAMINPTNPKDKATPEEVKIIETLKQKDLGNQDQLAGHNIDQGYVNIKRKNYLYTSRPIKITDKTCLSCHSTLEKAPQSLQLLYKQRKYVANQGLGWEFNTVIGAKVVYVPTTEVHKRAQRDFIILLGVFIIGIFAVVIIERATAKN